MKNAHEVDTQESTKVDGREGDQRDELATELDVMMADGRRLMAKAEVRGDYKTALSALKEQNVIAHKRAERAAARPKLSLRATLRKIAEIYGLDPDKVVGPAEADRGRLNDAETGKPMA
jgi:hypothetical protein